MTRHKKAIYLVGEFPLIVEYGEIFHTAGYHVLAKINPEKHQKVHAPRFISRSATLPKNLTCALELTNIDHDVKAKNLRLLYVRLSASTVIFSSSITVTATEQSSWLRHPERLIGIGALPTLSPGKLIEIAPTVHSNPESISRARNLIASLQRELAVVQDRAGMVMPRILCMLINEAAFALMENIATPADIDTAMKLGTNYPFGPVEWADRIGIRTVVSVLDAIYRETGEERYRTAPLLRHMAVGTRWWNT